jgi:hypothetical protein
LSERGLQVRREARRARHHLSLKMR